MKKTKTFLVIFHFDSDYSEERLRSSKMVFLRGSEKKSILGYLPQFQYERMVADEVFADYSKKLRQVTTWSPPHHELALLSEVLNYANLVNGLRMPEKVRLKKSLQFFLSLDYSEEVGNYYKKFREAVPFDKRVLFGFKKNPKTEKKEITFCIELCPEYIDYLKNVLNSYIK